MLQQGLFLVVPYIAVHHAGLPTNSYPRQSRRCRSRLVLASITSRTTESDLPIPEVGRQHYSHYGVDVGIETFSDMMYIKISIKTPIRLKCRPVLHPHLDSTRKNFSKFQLPEYQVDEGRGVY